MTPVENGRYGCRNRRPIDTTPPYTVQDGWIHGKRRETVVRTQWEGEGCTYNDRASDAKCEGCHWRYRA